MALLFNLRDSNMFLNSIDGRKDLMGIFS